MTMVLKIKILKSKEKTRVEGYNSFRLTFVIIEKETSYNDFNRFLTHPQNESVILSAYIFIKWRMMNHV
jgi:hypothetical protein